MIIKLIWPSTVHRYLRMTTKRSWRMSKKRWPSQTEKVNRSVAALNVKVPTFNEIEYIIVSIDTTKHTLTGYVSLYICCLYVIFEMIFSKRTISRHSFLKIYIYLINTYVQKVKYTVSSFSFPFLTVLHIVVLILVVHLMQQESSGNTPLCIPLYLEYLILIHLNIQTCY